MSRAAWNQQAVWPAEQTPSPEANYWAILFENCYEGRYEIAERCGNLPLARAVAGVDHICWRRTLIPLMNQLMSARTAPEFESLFEEFRGLFDRTCREAQLSAEHHIELLYENVSWLRSHGEHVRREIRER